MHNLPMANRDHQQRGGLGNHLFARWKKIDVYKRQEHMFFAEDRSKAVREMICARTVEEREAALAKVEPFPQGDFEAMYRIMGERPMTIRYLDPPLHEFLPTTDEDIKDCLLYTSRCV